MKRGLAFAKAVATDRALIGQLLRYGVTGGGVTAFGATAYWLLAKPANLPEQLANLLAWMLSVALGYTIHSSWSFKGHGSRADPMAMRLKFLAVALVGLGLNALWVDIFVHRLGGAEWWPIPAMVFVTPLVAFPLNRRWVFG